MQQIKRIPALVLLATTLCLLSACAGQSMTEQPSTINGGMEVELSNMGLAPELTNTIWLNTNDKSLRLADLRGKVVLLEFWTFDCYNCKNVIPSLKEWHNNYSEQGLVIIGNHFPEFAHEADLNNLKDAVQKLEIPYAVAQDNDGKTWSAYRVSYWPTLYLIDKQGNLRYTHIGEGRYNETEAAIKALLAEASS
jgi:thiol-disulfide isomerase/thioredoxin